MTCPFARNDGAYVLGALEPEERHRYEAHLRECDACSAAVRELAGLPGLLARLPADRVAALDADSDGTPAVPPTLLPALLRRIRRDRRTSRLRIALVTGAVAASVAAGSTMAVERMGETSPRPAARTVSLHAVGNRAVWGTVQLISWTWGTTVRVTCHADSSAAHANEVYTLFVTDRAGDQYPVSSWRSLPDEDVTVPAGVALPVEQVSSFQVKDDKQIVVMEGS